MFSPPMPEQECQMAKAPHLLIVEARFYEDIANELLTGAVAVLENANVTFERITVPGALEIPAAIAMAVEAGDENGVPYEGFIALGCVIRGETSHYEIVAGESARALMDLSTDECLALGNGIITCENSEQAWARANTADKNKGGAAAQAALAMIEIKQKLGN
jgi:6,7-dimethyl-8-ribityllumazine synthase